MNLFISYSHDSEEHKEWVAKLASNLLSHGVDVILDRWDLRLGDDLLFFMENGLSKSNLVLVICSSLYVEKANAGKCGTGYEKRILSADMLSGEKKNFIIQLELAYLILQEKQKHFVCQPSNFKHMEFL